MRTLVLLMAALFLAAGLASAPAQAIGVQKEMKVGFIYISPIGEEGWSYAHDQARKFLSTLPGVTTSYVESVPEGQDAERIIQSMARKHYDIIFATSFGYMDSMLKVAEQFPNSTFMHCSGYKTAPNMSNYFGRIYQARYLTGLVAGSMTQSNVIGYVAAFPLPEVIRGINAFTLGVRAVNPKAEVRVVWTKSWYDPAMEKSVAKNLIKEGADVIAQHQDSNGPQEAAQEQGTYSIGYNTDMSRVAPKARMTSAIWSWNPVLRKRCGEGPRRDVEKRLLLVRHGNRRGGYRPLRPHGPAKRAQLDRRGQGRHQKRQTRCLRRAPSKIRKALSASPRAWFLPTSEPLGMDWFVEGVIGTID